MKVLEHSFRFIIPGLVGIELSDSKIASYFMGQAQLCEYAGRICYHTEERQTTASYDKFLRARMADKPAHTSLLEHGKVSVSLTTSRGVLLELRTHRHKHEDGDYQDDFFSTDCAFSVQSTRYVRYKDGQMGFIRPSTWDQYSQSDKLDWEDNCRRVETIYGLMLSRGRSPQQARDVLPNALATSLVMSANFAEWRHIFQLRAISKQAHPDFRALFIPMYEAFRGYLPCVFDMGNVE
jgi:thymidylate synthase (FAD)